MKRLIAYTRIAPRKHLVVYKRKFVWWIRYTTKVLTVPYWTNTEHAEMALDKLIKKK